MEVIDDKLSARDELRSLDFGMFRTLARNDEGRSLYAPKLGMLQRVYKFPTGGSFDLSLRRTRGLALSRSIGELIWVEALNAQGELVFLGIESEYVYERTGMLVTPGLVAQANQNTVPVYIIIQAVLYELEPILGFEVQGLRQQEDLPEEIRFRPLRDYMALDHRGTCKVLIASSPACLDTMESEVRNYCSEYLTCRQDWAAKIKTPVTLGLYAIKKRWSAEELGDLDCGDLLALTGGWANESTYLLRGYFLLRQKSMNSLKYEVQYNMNDDSLSMEFKSDTIDDAQEHGIEMDVPRHEQIDLDILIGHTRIPLGELCAVQSGTLIELGQHSLPLVTLCVNGEPILEGELVHFKDQLMVQVSKRLA